MAETPQRNLDFNEVLKEQDVFRLVIRGHAAIEDRIDATIAEAFGGGMPPELTRLPFRTRLALLVALTGLPQPYANAIAVLAKLRHDFAHGWLAGLSTDRMKVLVDAFRPILPEQAQEAL